MSAVSVSNVSAARSLRAHHPDYVIALVIAILLAVGLVMMYSVSPILSQKLTGSVDRNYYFLNQIKYIGAGIVVWIVAASVPYTVWRRYAPTLLGLSIVAMLALLVPGLSTSQNGATRWLHFGSLQFQPAEILKVALILYLAAWFERRAEELRSLWDGVLPFVVMVGAACFVIVVFQRDMGTMAVLAFAALGMFFAAGLRITHLGLLIAAGLGAGLAAIAAFPHRVERVTTFLNLKCDDLAALASSPNYHACQALIATGSGGLFGLGLGRSIQVYGYLPEAANDSIFAIIAEEFGLIGALAVVGLLGYLVYRGLMVARSAPDMFARLVATGISLWLLFQAFINIGAMVSILPLTGIPLPFISYGGTSLIISLFGAGILLNISKYTIREGSDADSRQRRGFGRTHSASARSMRRASVAR
ncbi:MAG TPA: putative lipid II flippase FtsW [Candidatus Saccharimonadia bacterium]|nr:putative lipid II flippase FtsW [Candidatus Saccharimonadia bacterium]